MTHKIDIKIYYDDTDAGGVVYYANYLKYLERGRTEFFIGKGIDVYGLHRQGLYFVVAHVDIKFKRPALLGDTITVTTDVKETGNASLLLNHSIYRGGEILAEADVRMAHVDGEFKPRRLPEAMKNIAVKTG